MALELRVYRSVSKPSSDDSGSERKLQGVDGEYQCQDIRAFTGTERDLESNFRIQTD